MADHPLCRHPLVVRASRFAMAAHAGQVRRYSGEPYWVHPQAVARMVAEAGGDAEMVASGWLHDVLEDTATSADDLRAEFGERVAALVVDLTSIACEGERCVRKAVDRMHTACAHPDAKTVKLADIIDNVRNIAEQDPEFARIYLVEKARLLHCLREGHAGLFTRARTFIEQGLTRLGLPLDVLPTPLSENQADPH